MAEKDLSSFKNKGSKTLPFWNNTLKEIFHLNGRIFEIKSSPNINLIEKPLIINKRILNSLKKKSINFLKKNLKSSFL